MSTGREPDLFDGITFNESYFYTAKSLWLKTFFLFFTPLKKKSNADPLALVIEILDTSFNLSGIYLVEVNFASVWLASH